jgi:EAL domain-containing protein (putative c-di-GMP-specific phosphodiesterase class I)
MRRLQEVALDPPANSLPLKTDLGRAAEREGLARTGFPTAALALEITESQSVSENAANHGTAHELRALGRGATR